ncbi:MAG: LamG domain-containing protein, partial [Lentisphaeria bacterium]|nr:LamG domain-containing protein [Lentisphaeria bacterium]
LQTCGNATREGTEVCDDGPGGLCLDDCSGMQTCGNAEREGTEVCDDGPGEGEGLCLDDCSGLQVCGDNAQEGTEVCDTGAICAVDCNATCTGPGNTLKKNDLFGDGSIIVTYLFDHGTKSLLQETGSYGVYDAQPVGAPSIVTGHIAGALLLHDGDALAFDAVPLPDGADPRAFSLWLNLDAQPTSQAGILTYGSDSGAQDRLFSLCILASGELAVDTNGTVIGSGFYPLLNEWVHLVVSYDGVNLGIFVDGALAVEYPIALATGTDTHGKKLGDYDGSHPLSGAIDHLRVFDRALLETEVLALKGECGFPDPLEGSSFSTLVFEDDFGGDLSAWNTWGSPLPRILSDGQASNGFAFDTNGDANYHSGGDTLFSLDPAEGFAVEFRAKQPQDLNVSNKWFYLDIGLTHTQSSDNGTGARVYFRISG